MSAPDPSDFDKLRERFERAEGQLLRDNYRERPKRKYLKARCPHCGYVVLYAPKEDFKGDLRCSQCGKTFHIVRMDDFLRDDEVITKMEIKKIIGYFSVFVIIILLFSQWHMWNGRHSYPEAKNVIDFVYEHVKVRKSYRIFYSLYFVFSLIAAYCLGTSKSPFI